jgi:hypothetical protein
MLYMQLRAPDDGRKKRLKHVERLTGINKLRKVASCWLYSENMLAMHGPTNVKVVLGGEGRGGGVPVRISERHRLC